MTTSLTGIWTALITPFNDGQLDEESVRKLIEQQIEGGVDGLLVNGTTGEAVTLSTDEQLQLVALIKSLTDGRKPIMAGTSSNSTAEAVELTAQTVKLGVDCVLVASPGYNKPTQAGVVEHFVKVSEAADDTPVMLYNVPGRTANNILPQTVAEIARRCPNVNAIKEACGDLVQMSNVRRLAPSITLLSGDDGLTLPVLSVGGQGAVSVISNLVPGHVSAMWKAWQDGDRDAAAAKHLELLPLIDAAFCESNPIPVKYGMSLLGIGDGSVRLPLVPATETARGRIEKELKALGVI